MAGPGAEEVHWAGESLICFSSKPPFAPDNEDQLLAELERGLPPDIKPVTVRSKDNNGRLTLWVLVKGNFGREMVKFALRQNPHLMLLQVENAPPFPRLWLRPRASPQ